MKFSYQRSSSITKHTRSTKNKDTKPELTVVQRSLTFNSNQLLIRPSFQPVKEFTMIRRITEKLLESETTKLRNFVYDTKSTEEKNPINHH